MNAWNDTKAINFKQVTDYRKANIIVNAGITQLPAVPRGYLYGSIISLNNFFLDQVNPEIALSVLNTNWVTLLVWSTTTVNHQLWILQLLINVFTPSNNVISMLLKLFITKSKKSRIIVTSCSNYGLFIFYIFNS